MTCVNCSWPKEPGRLMKVTKDFSHCAICGDVIKKSPTDPPQENNNLWDQYFHSICIAVASKSPCLSRKIGAVLVRDKSIVATGYNGPSRGIPHCGHERIMKDNELARCINFIEESCIGRLNTSRYKTECPRKILGYESGTHMELCPAQHAEVNAISNAARLGVSVLGSTLYMNCITPCKNCFGTLINAGILEIVVDDIKMYDRHTQFLVDNSTIKIRQFNL